MSNKLKFLAEYVDYQEIEVLNEVADDVKKTRIKAPFLISEIKNKNGRIYPRSIIEREVKKYNETKIKRKMAYGELDHPPSPTVQGKEIAIHVDELFMEGNDAIGIATILNTPNGQIVKNVLADGYAWGLSSRGLGSLKGDIVDKSYVYIAEDVVTDPSAYKAWADKILESREFIMEDDGNVVEFAINNLQNKVDKKYSDKLIMVYMREFLDEIRSKI